MYEVVLLYYIKLNIVLYFQDCKHFTKSVLSDKTVTTTSTNLIAICNKLYEAIVTKTHDKSTIQYAQNVIKETSSWVYSTKAFSKKVDTSYSEAFPDLAKPLQNSLYQIIYSVTSLNDLIREFVVKVEQGPNLHNILTSLMTYPDNIPSKDEREKHLNRFLSANFLQLLNRNVIAVNEDLYQAELECLQ